jgi:cell division protein FtsZ
MSNAGTALMGVGEAEGNDKAQDAVEMAIESPLVEVNIEGARGVLINITGGPDLTMAEIEESAKTITQKTSPDANIIFGATIDPNLKGKIKVSVIATGFDTNQPRLYSVKKPPTTTNTSSSTATSSSATSPSPVVPKQVQQFLEDKELPAGVDIVDEFDIPAFLRKNQ